MPEYRVSIMGKSIRNSRDIGKFHSKHMPQIGEHHDIEVEDGVFQEYVIASSGVSSQGLILYVVHPGRKSHGLIRKVRNEVLNAEA